MNEQKTYNHGEQGITPDQELNEEQHEDLSNYSSSRDRQKRELRLPARYANVNCTS